MAGYLSLAAKLVLNVHDLNNEGSVGQSLDIRQIRMVDENGKELKEMPAVSGRMMKHWHLEHMTRAEMELDGNNRKLCDDCKLREPERTPKDESGGIKNCIICDTHGFLSAEKQVTEEGTKKVIPRRSSCINFSWLLPTLDASPVAKQVLHSRVTSPESQKESQMPFHKSYASGMFAFVTGIDLGRIGMTIKASKVLDDVELKRRQKLAVQALLPICLGAFGASQSHALPHAKCVGLLAAISTTEKPVPNLISPIYPDGFKESIALLKAMGDSVKWWTYGEGLESTKSTAQDVFEEILKAI
jgi:CRISPR-associated protein Cst2